MIHIHDVFDCNRDYIGKYSLKDNCEKYSDMSRLTLQILTSNRRKYRTIDNIDYHSK